VERRADSAHRRRRARLAARSPCTAVARDRAARRGAPSGKGAAAARWPDRSFPMPAKHLQLLRECARPRGLPPAPPDPVRTMEERPRSGARA
jgi:hypothetical protein